MAMGASGRSETEEWRSRLPERRRSSGMCGNAGDPVAERRRSGAGTGEAPLWTAQNLRFANSLIRICQDVS